MRKILFILPVIVTALLGLLLILGLSNDEKNILPSTMIEREAPELPVMLLDGFETTEVSGDLVAVNFWASWCGPCRAEHPLLIKLADLGVPIVGVNFKDNPEKATQFLNDLGNPFSEVRLDDSGSNAINWGVSGVPETFFLDGSGKIIFRHFGPITDESFEKDILPLLGTLE